MSNTEKGETEHKTVDIKSKIDKQNEKFQAPGWRNLQSTSAFRAINFELYVKPNLLVMIPGLLVAGGCIAYIAYMRATTDKNTYTTINEDGSLTLRKRTSKWD